MCTVPAVYKEPTIQVMDKDNQTRFALIERGTVFNGKWNTVELNRRDFNESGKFNFSIENWLFQTVPTTRWFPRHKSVKMTIRNQFKLIQKNDDNGFFSFQQNIKAQAMNRFNVVIIVIRKQTESLEILYTSSLLSFVPVSSGESGKNAIKEYCREWSNRANEINIDIKNLTNCPCTLESAKVDPNLDVDFTCSATQHNCHENVNAYRCFLMKIDKM